MPHTPPFRYAFRRFAALLLFVLAGIAIGDGRAPLLAQTAPVSLGITVNDSAIAPGELLAAGITVNNPGAGPAADVYFGLILPDGVTLVSTGPGVGVRFGRLDDLRSLVPVARGLSLAAPFTYADPAFFAYTFNGTEPNGVYRIFFAAFRTGALSDGVIGGGEMLALTTRDITVGPAINVQVDMTRTATVTVTSAGGTVQTTAAGGAVMTLTVPPGSVRTPTAISLAPLLVFAGPNTSPLVAGVRAEPSGLVFNPPATLTLSLPPAFQPGPFGLRGLVTNNRGQQEQVVPVTMAANVATVPVSHFSTIRLTLNADWPVPICLDVAPSTQKNTACLALTTLATAERARIAAQGGGLGVSFRNSVQTVMQTWLQTGILPRLADAQLPGATDPQLKPMGALAELLEWKLLYLDVFSVTIGATGNAAAGIPLGALIDQAMEQARLTYLGGMNQNNVRCVADKGNVFTYLSNVRALADRATTVRGAAATPVDYCIDIRISASPLPVLTPGTPVAMQLDVRTRFSDNTDLTGTELILAITATNATVSPAGGTVRTPVVGPVTVTPTTTRSTITISATPVDDSGTLRALTDIGMIPARSLVVEAGAPLPTLTFTDGALGARFEVRDDALLGNRVVNDTTTALTDTTTKTVTLPSVTVGTSVTYTSSGNSALTRTFARTPNAVVVNLSAPTQTALSVSSLALAVDVLLEGRAFDHWCVNLPVDFNVTPASNNPALTAMTIDHQVLGIGVDLKTSGTTRLTAGPWCFNYSGTAQRFYESQPPTPVTGPTSTTFTYSLEFRPAP